MNKVIVKTKNNQYDIYINDVLNQSDILEHFIANKQVMVVTNTTVAPLYLNVLQLACTNAASVAAITLPDGEQHKTQDSMTLIYDALMQHNYNRDSVIIALGGGVVGDMAGFAAASFQRGVDFIQIPTTLLSQVDSSVGGKTGINHALGKNMIGAFKQPKAVLIQSNVLDTLPEREVSAGIAEIIKYALINDIDFLAWLELNMVKLVNLDKAVVNEAITRSCQHKANIVNEDEFESGRRALLNLGHTFGHVIENYMGYGQWLHGEAVSVGMLQASYMSYLLGWISKDDVIRVKTLLQMANLPVDAPNIPVDEALKLMARDKKVKSGKVRLVLLKQLGKAVITDDFDDELLKQTLSTATIL